MKNIRVLEKIRSSLRHIGIYRFGHDVEKSEPVENHVLMQLHGLCAEEAEDLQREIFKFYFSVFLKLEFLNLFSSELSFEWVIPSHAHDTLRIGKRSKCPSRSG